MSAGKNLDTRAGGRVGGRAGECAGASAAISWYAGIDAGGTATKGCLYVPGKGVAGRGRAMAGNARTVGPDGVAQAVRAALGAAAEDAGLEELPKLDALLAGVAGARLEADLERVKEAVWRELAPARTWIVPDAVVALAAGAWGDDGIAVIAGTGSAAWAARGGAWVGAGGWGYLLGDEGSGFSIGLAALRAVVRSSEGRAPRTSLESGILGHLHLDSCEALVPFVYRDPIPKAEIASLAPVVLAGWKQGDRAAHAIVEEAFEELVRLVRSAWRRAAFKDPVPVVTAGGLFADERFFAVFSDRVAGELGLRAVRPAVEPDVAACVLAMQRTGTWAPGERERVLTRRRLRLETSG